MKSSQFALIGLLFTTAIFTACGDDVTKVTKIEENSGMEIVASADSLEKCTEEISGEMKFASKENAVFVCADSAWKNVSETKKSGCSAEALSDSSGFKIVCDGDSIGVVKNGAKGTDGKTGEAGESCKLAEGPVLESGSAVIQTSFVICGGDTVTLSDGLPGEGCELSDNGDGTVSVICGDASTTLYKALCGNKPYDPDSSFCVEDSVVSFCDGMLYNLDSSFCANGTIAPLGKKIVWDLMNPAIEYEMFVDERDSQMYRSVHIGEQTWMAENLNYAYKPDTASFYYEDSLGRKRQQYGRLYTWDAAMAVCPEGWHLPDTTEWDLLKSYVAGKAGAVGTALKTTSGWEERENDQGSFRFSAGNGTDNFGFSALPSGFRSIFKLFQDETTLTTFWTSSPSQTKNSAHARSLSSSTTALTAKINENKNIANPVRCVMD